MANPPQKSYDSFDEVKGPISQFDQVGILRIDNLAWLSTQRTTDFRGQWAVSHMMGDWLVLSRGEFVLRIPVADVRVLIKYSLGSMFDYMRDIADGKGQKAEAGTTKQPS